MKNNYFNLKFICFNLLIFLFLTMGYNLNAQVPVTPDGGFTSATQYPSPGEYTVTIPAGITLIEVKLWGGGGGCGANVSTSNTGGPGGFTEARFNVTPGQQYKLIVGSGGGSDDQPPTVPFGFPGDRPANCSGGQAGGLSGLFTGTTTVASTDMARALLIAGGGGGASGFNPPLGWARGGSGNLAAPLSGGETSMKGVNSPIGCLPYELGGGGGGYSGGSAHNRTGGGNTEYPINAGGGNGGTAYVHSSATLSTVSGTPDWSHIPPQTGDFHYVAGHANGSINPNTTNFVAGNGLAIIQFGVAVCSSPPTLTLGTSSGSICGTTPVTVSGNVFGGSATSVTITENGAGTVSPASSSTSPFSFTYTPAAGDIGNTVTITVTTNNPAGAPCVPVTRTYLLTVNAIQAAPTVGIITQPTCATPTGSVVLSGLPTGGWTIERNPGGVTNSGSTASTTITSLPANNTYTFTVRNNVTGCVSVPSSNVVINAAPATPTLGGANSVCVGATANVTPNSGGTWSSSNTSIATVTNAGVVTGVSGGTVTLTFTETSTGCSSTKSFTVTSLLPAPAGIHCN